MNKNKTRKLITKRIRVTKNGKVMRRKAFARHLNAKKSAKRKTNLRRVTVANKVQSRKIRKALGL